MQNHYGHEGTQREIINIEPLRARRDTRDIVNIEPLRAPRNTQK